MRLPAALVAALILTAPVAVRAASVVVGAVYSADGAGAVARSAVETALEIVNGTHEAVPVLMGQGGGLDRLGGAKFEVVYADDADDPAKAAVAAERLVVEQHVVALIGGLSDASAAAISRVAERHGLPFLALDSSVRNTGDLSWFFRIGRTPASDARSVLRYLGAIASANGRSVQSVAVVYEEGPAGRDRSAAVRGAADAAGLHLVDAPVPAGPGALDGVASVIAAATPDVVLSELGGPQEATLFALLASRGVGPLVIMQRTHSPGSTQGVFSSASFTADPVPARPGVPVVGAAFEARAGRPLDPVTAREITGVLLLADVVNRAGSTKPIDLRTALMATDTPGGETLMLWEGIRFDDTGQNVLATPALQQVLQGGLQVVAPEPVAVAAPVWPAKKD